MAEAPSRWAPGAHILNREVWRGRVWTARPVIVVQDEPDLTALYLPIGTPCKEPRMPDGGPLTHTLPDEWILVDHARRGATLFLCPSGAMHMVMLFWSPPHADFLGWYVNLQQPMRRTSLGFDYLDQELDIVISPDRSTWHWKDEDKFRDLERRGRISHEQAALIRAEGERVIAQLHTAGSLFTQGWQRWVPPATWTVPRLSVGWDVM